jgi:hypothetical protein
LTGFFIFDGSICRLCNVHPLKFLNLKPDVRRLRALAAFDANLRPVAQHDARAERAGHTGFRVVTLEALNSVAEQFDNLFSSESATLRQALKRLICPVSGGIFLIRFFGVFLRDFYSLIRPRGI